jgi:hypothetical protein
MTDTMFDYESYSLEQALVRIHGLLDNCPEGKAKEYFQTISEVMTALAFAVSECRAQRIAYGKLIKRVEIMESLLALQLKVSKNDNITHSWETPTLQTLCDPLHDDRSGA